MDTILIVNPGGQISRHHDVEYWPRRTALPRSGLVLPPPTGQNAALQSNGGNGEAAFRLVATCECRVRVVIAKQNQRDRCRLVPCPSPLLVVPLKKGRSPISCRNLGIRLLVAVLGRIEIRIFQNSGIKIYKTGRQVLTLDFSTKLAEFLFHSQLTNTLSTATQRRRISIKVG